MANEMQLVAYLGAQYRNKNLTAKELVTVIEKAQVTMDEEFALSSATSVDMRCQFQGCNHHRYPASSFCMYHVTGRSTFAARLRSAIRRDKKAGVDVSEFDRVLRLITENIQKPK